MIGVRAHACWICQRRSGSQSVNLWRLLPLSPSWVYVHGFVISKPTKAITLRLLRIFARRVCCRDSPSRPRLSRISTARREYSVPIRSPNMTFTLLRAYHEMEHEMGFDYRVANISSSLRNKMIQSKAVISGLINSHQS